MLILFKLEISSVNVVKDLMKNVVLINYSYTI